MMYRLKAVAAALLLVVSTSAVRGQAEEPQGLRLMTFNIRYGTANDGDNSWTHRRDLVFGVVRNQNADIVGLQEALRFQIDEITRAVPGYSEIGVGRDDGAARGEACSILYRTDRFSVAAAGTFWLSDTPRAVASASFGNTIPRICTWARLIDKDSGEGIYVLNAHLDHRSEPSRTRSARLIAEFVRNLDFSDPVVLMGDFNAGKASDALRVLTSASGGAEGGNETNVDAGEPLFRDSFRVLHPNQDNVGTFNSWRGETGGDKIDYILVPPQTTVREATIIRTNDNGRYPSDHSPVTAEILLPGEETDGN
jgi:endonuclease/exonuclease/phosphatase family metal-dependent hydrolase